MENLTCRDLMIGDWVMYNGNPHKVSHLNFRGFSKVGLRDVDGVHHTSIDPIPLNEDILLKNGFEVHPFGCAWYQEKGIDFQNYIIVHFRRNGEVRKVEMDFVNKIKAEYRDIYFVHHLQHELRRIGKEIEL